VRIPCRTLLLSCLLGSLARRRLQAQDGQGHAGLSHHPPEDQRLHEKFYSTWRMPDHPSVSCCNDADCYPTEIRTIDGNIYAKRREDGKYIPVPTEKSSGTEDNPDGRNHLCGSSAEWTPAGRYGVLLRIGRRHVRFTLVNGRTPRPDASA